jgi:hypothetical protein
MLVVRAALPAQIQKGNGNPPPPRALVTLVGLTVTGGTDTGNGWTVSIPGKPTVPGQPAVLRRS